MLHFAFILGRRASIVRCPSNAKVTSLPQRTIRRPVHVIGIGVHSGATSRVTLRPADANTGIRFVRADRGGASIPALVDNVGDTLLSTSLLLGGHRVATVEHLMSALWGLEIDNVIVELVGEEVPILDGSAAPFVSLIRTGGVVEQRAPRQFIRITDEIEVADGDSFARLSPCEGFRAAYTFVADHPVYNRHPKRSSIDFAREPFVRSVASARTFGLIRELPRAQAMNRCLGSSLDNAVGISDDEVLNPEGLRCADEFVKHKMLDAIGDLYLLGKPVLGAFEGLKSGHTLNVRLAQAVLANRHAYEIVGAPAVRQRTFVRSSRAAEPSFQVG